MEEAMEEAEEEVEASSIEDLEVVIGVIEVIVDPAWSEAEDASVTSQEVAVEVVEEELLINMTIGEIALAQAEDHQAIPANLERERRNITKKRDQQAAQAPLDIVLQATVRKERKRKIQEEVDHKTLN